MKVMFNTRAAIFNGILESNETFVSSAIYKAFIEINETESEAAAASVPSTCSHFQYLQLK